MRRGGGLLLLVVLGLFACGDDIQFADPPVGEAETTGELPAGHPPLPTPEAVPSHGQGGEGADPFADPSEASTPLRDNTPDPRADEVVYRGEVRLAEGFQLPPTYTVYVSAGRPPNGRPPVLSRRYDKPTFPLTFELRRRDLAFGDTEVTGPLCLYLILSEKGPVLDKSGLYVRTTPGSPVALGAPDLVLTLELDAAGR